MRHIKFIFASLILNIKKEWQYKTSFIMKIVFMLLNNASFVLIFYIISKQVHDFNGYGFNEILLLFGLSAGAYGIACLFFGGIFDMTDYIYEGKLDVFLTQPKSVLINVACSRSDISAIGDIASVFIFLSIANAVWWWYLAVIPIIICGGIIFASCHVMFSTLGFYIKRGDTLATMVTDTHMKASQYPPVIFNTTVKIMLYTFIPAAFITFVPAANVLLSFNWLWFGIWIAVTALWVFLAFFFFNIGLRKYNSGSLMGERV
jgi:ABC-2 type transport system permease protein